MKTILTRLQSTKLFRATAIAMSLAVGLSEAGACSCGGDYVCWGSPPGGSPPYSWCTPWWFEGGDCSGDVLIGGQLWSKYTCTWSTDCESFSDETTTYGYAQCS